VTDRPHLCPLDNLTECPRWAGPCSVQMALDCPEVDALAAAAAAVRVEGDGGQT
jgi:hypothetical protein